MTILHKRLESRFAALTSYVYAHKFIAVGVMFLITIALASQMPKLTIDTRDESFFYEDDPTLIAYNEFRDRFGQDDMFFIAMQPENGLTREFWPILNRLHTELAESTPHLGRFRQHRFVSKKFGGFRQERYCG